VQFKKFSSGFEVFDFTVRMYAPTMIKLVDDDTETMSAIRLTKEDEARIKKNSIKGKDEEKEALPSPEQANQPKKAEAETEESQA